MIQINGTKKIYGNTCVLDIAELMIPDGQIFGLIGNNGAGKTTLFNLLLDLIAPDSGQITNKDIIVNESEKWKSYTSAFLDESFLIPYLTPEEYMEFLCDIRKFSKTAFQELLQKFTSVFNDEILNQKKYIRDLSKGNQKKIGIFGAFIGNPEVIILDEPFANLDPTTQIRLKTFFKQTANTGKQTLLISSHDLTHTTEVCNRIVLLEKGLIIKDIMTGDGTLKELEAYFSKNANI